MRAILSVYEKAGVAEFAAGLSGLGWELFSTGNTKRAIGAAGVPVRSISELTGFPEILDGRVKTLHPAVHAGLLARRDLPEHVRELESAGLGTIDLVCNNLYPFLRTVRGGADITTALENIDIGGPAMLRAAAKNFPHVIVIVDPDDYAPVLQALGAGGLGLDARQGLAKKAFQHVASYDAAVAEYLRGPDERFPEHLTLAYQKRFNLRYGENPHQEAAFYAEQSVFASGAVGIAGARQLHGKELSFNNILDADAAWSTAHDFPEQTVVIVKHTNPCGIATHEAQEEAYRRALAGDPVSAYGGIVAINRRLDAPMAEAMKAVFYEIVVAPSFSEQALAVLKKKRDLRILEMGEAADQANGLDYRRVSGGLLVQTPDAYPDDQLVFTTQSKRAPTPAELDDLRFAWRAVRHVKSNAIVLVKDRQLVGMGAGQPNRVVSVHLAVRAAGERAPGSVLASDAFFPFPDGPQLAVDAGVTAIVQPGGSIRDVETVAVCDGAGIALVHTGVRHFRH
ncbi:MAG TPA: bifunctional phosphoribosylaminoimidazolecarboxamide formyltransferase/IMP cyclohydrolase [Dehalococcoidia bacterium]